MTKIAEKIMKAEAALKNERHKRIPERLAEQEAAHNKHSAQYKAGVSKAIARKIAKRRAQ
jgi:hypothetical protein